MLQNQARRLNVDYPLSDDHINVKTLFRQLHPTVGKSVGMSRAPGELNLKLESIRHREIDDAKNIAKILHWCLLQI
ncbi:hypothetical protein ACMGDK_15435 [Chryseobacterium sp. DT-3]|uniref:hypothetical protein n=1 Tax=Chryseobacterium sp. DT-3 TaxID=3396164 RepID=UPI003F1ADABF